MCIWLQARALKIRFTAQWSVTAIRRRHGVMDSGIVRSTAVTSSAVVSCRCLPVTNSCCSCQFYCLLCFESVSLLPRMASVV